MENYFLDKDINVLIKTATSFPDGVMAAHQALHTILKKIESRRFFGISYPDKNGIIIYKAAAEALAPDIVESYGLEEFIIKGGEFISIFIPSFCDDIPSVSKAFNDLLEYPGIDLNGYCLEMYTNDTDIRCMVRLK